MCSAADLVRLKLFLRRGKWLGYCTNDMPAVPNLFNSSDEEFFHRVKTNSNHVLQPYLPDKTDIPYRLHNMTLINKNSLVTLIFLSVCYINIRIKSY